MSRVRPARATDAGAMQRIERLAGQRFREVGMPAIADDEPFEIDVLAQYTAAGRAWVAEGEDQDAVGYALIDIVDGAGHLEQISVVPDRHGQGFGRALVDAVVGWARREGLVALTLTTFSDVPWNRPLYEHLGFRVLTESEIGPGLRTLRADEAAEGLDPSIRVCMRLDVASWQDAGL